MNLKHDMQSFQKEEMAWKVVLRLFTTFVIVERHGISAIFCLNIRLLPTVFAPMFKEFNYDTKHFLLGDLLQQS